MTSKPKPAESTSTKLAPMPPSGSTQRSGSPSYLTCSAISSAAQPDRPHADTKTLETHIKNLLSLPVSTHSIDENTLACHRTNRANNPCSNLGQYNRILSNGLVHESTTVL